MHMCTASNKVVLIQYPNPNLYISQNLLFYTGCWKYAHKIPVFSCKM